jgi:hypothetical protein
MKITRTTSLRLITAVAVLFLTGCASMDKQVFKARQIFDRYPNEAAKYCGDKFPVADSIVSLKHDTIRGKVIDYTPAINGFNLLLDSAKEITDLKQSKVTDLAGQLSFSKLQLSKANSLISDLSTQLKRFKAAYKPCETDTITNTYTKTRENTAKVFALTAQIAEDSQDKQKLQKVLQSETARSARRFYWIIVLCLIITAYFGIKAYRLFGGGAFLGTIFHG